MRIITGEAKGKKLLSLNTKKVRPTTDRVKESLFNILGNSVFYVRGLDLFAGFGSLGLEALSRGAEHFTFVERDYKNADIIKKNIKLCKFEKRTEVIISDVFQYLKNTEKKYDMVFMDPPYEKGLIQKTIFLLIKNNLLTENSLIICEYHKNEEINLKEEQIEEIKTKNYGETVIKIYQYKEETHED